MVSSLVNVGSGRDFTTGMGSGTLDGNFIEIADILTRQMERSIFTGLETLQSLKRTQVHGSRAQRRAPAIRQNTST